MKNTLFLLAVTLMLSCGAFGQSLSETVVWMQNTLRENGNVFEYQDSPVWYAKTTLHTLEGNVCKVDFLQQTSVHPKNEPVDDYTLQYLFNLKDIEPDSIKFYEYDRSVTHVRFNTRNYAHTIEEKHGDGGNGFFQQATLDLPTLEYAARFAKALKHAVILCGGKPSTF
jgi:hypothetical protein